MSFFRFVLAASAALFLAGCAAPTPKVDLKAGSLRAGQTVAVVEPPPINHYFMWSMHPGMAFGAIGGAIAGAQFEAQGKEVAGLMAKEGFVPHVEILNAFTRELEGAGYKVEVVRNAWKPDGNVVRLDVPRIPASYDRVFVLTPAMFGFYSHGLAGNYEPLLRLRVALYGPDREKPLYDGHHVTGMEPKGAGWIIVPSVQTNFASYQLMVSQPPAMADALRKGIVAVARSAGRELGMPAPRGPVVAAVDASRVAGTWRGRMSCGEWTGPGQTANPKPWSQPVTLVVDGSNAVMTRGGAQTDYDERVSGPIAGDFSTTMQGQGAMHSSPGAPWFTQASGRFEGEGSAQRFTGTASLRNVHGNVMRSCTLSLARVPAP